MTVTNTSTNTSNFIQVTSGKNKNENIVAELMVLEEKVDNPNNNKTDNQLEVTLKVPMAGPARSKSPLSSSFSPREFLNFAGGYDTVKRAFTQLFDEDGDGIVTREEFMSAVSQVRANSKEGWTDKQIMFLFDELDTLHEGTLQKAQLIRGFRPYFEHVNSVDDIGSMLSIVMKCCTKNRERKDALAGILKSSNYYWECFVAALPLVEMSLDIAVCYALFFHGHYTLGMISLVFQALSGRLGFFVDFGQKRDPMIKLQTPTDVLVIYIPFATFMAHKLAKVPIHFTDLVIGELVTLTIFYVLYFQSIVTRWQAATLVLSSTDPATGECRLLVSAAQITEMIKDVDLQSYQNIFGQRIKTTRHNVVVNDIPLTGDNSVVQFMTEYDDVADICRAGYVIEVVQGIAHPLPQIIIQLIAGLSTGLLDDPDWQPVFVASILVSSLNLMKAFYILGTDWETVTSALRNFVEETADGNAMRDPEDASALVEG